MCVYVFIFLVKFFSQTHRWTKFSGSNMRNLLLTCHSWNNNGNPKRKGYEFCPCLLPGIKHNMLQKNKLRNNNELTWNIPSCELITMVSEQAMQDNKREEQSEVLTAIMSMHSKHYQNAKISQKVQYWHSYPGVMHRYPVIIKACLIGRNECLLL